MSARYEISEGELDVLAITGPEGTRYIDGEEIEARVIRQQSADIAELRAELAAAVGERDRIKGDYGEAAHFARHFIRDDPNITPRGAIIRLGDKCTDLFVRLQQAEARLSAIDSAPVVAHIANKIGPDYFPCGLTILADSKLPPLGTDLIAKPAKD